MFFIGLYSRLVFTILAGVATLFAGVPKQPAATVVQDTPKPVVAKVAAVVPKPVEKPVYCGIDENGNVKLVGDAATCFVPLHELLEQKGISDPSDVRLEVSKSQRLLRLFVNGELVKDYVMGIGHNPDQPKAKRSDYATPVGSYYVCQKIPNSRFFMSLKISYPNDEDARRGVEDGVIDQATCDRIVSAINAREAPPMDTGLGGDICIHGGGKGELDKSGSPAFVKVRDWTAGCMALDNSEMKELFSFIPIGTPVKIMP